MIGVQSDPVTRLTGAVRDLLPQLRAATADTDRDRRVPDHLIEALRAAGVYRMLVPVELGGDAVDLQTFLDVVETVSNGNAAAGWDISTSSWHTMNALTLPPDGIARIYGGGPDVAFAGGFAGGGRAVATGGGYRVTGRWRFGSGCTEAAWMVAVAGQVFDGDALRKDTDGQPLFCLAVLPRHDVTIHDTWNVMGMRGTGSHDFSLDDAFVPASMTQAARAPRPWSGPLYRLPGTVFTLDFSAVATGIARRAIDSLIDLAGAKTPAGSQALLRERVQVQEAVARAEVLLESARAYRSGVVADVWATAEAGEPPSVEPRARLRLAGTNAAECAVRAVDLMFGAGGTTSIEDENPLSHCFRDVHVVAQNINVLPTFYEHAGRVLLGMDPGMAPARF